MSNNSRSTKPKKLSISWLAVLAILIAFASFGVIALLVSIYERKQESRTPFVRVVEVTEVSTDPAPWGLNFPYQYESYLKTVNDPYTQYGGNHAFPASKLKSDPWLVRLYSGYAFSVDYREARGHAYMLFDQEATERVTKFQQSGACLHCHSSIIPTYRRVGLEAMGEQPTLAKLATDFELPAVMRGFNELSQKKYEVVREELNRTPDGINSEPLDPHLGNAHPVSCIDCHDPETMSIRVTRPGFLLGIDKLAKSEDAVPHFPSIQKWRDDGSLDNYDPNLLASRQEMRSFVCGQCHVEYYCADKMTLTYPWENGLKMEAIEAAWNETDFPDGQSFYDYVHEETQTKVFKAQHPEFELWSQGIHARSGVSCCDCHMPYEKQGATKVSSHWVRSPMTNINRACQTCHNIPEQELKLRVETIKDRTRALIDRAAIAMTDMLDAIIEARKGGATDGQLAPIRDLQRKAMWRLDFIASENSQGFHARQEAARILAESIDYSRQAVSECYRMALEPDGESPAN